MIPRHVATAKYVLKEDEDVLYGVFGHIGASGYFPPRQLLNEFLMIGTDPCDQDGLMAPWIPFALEPAEYDEVKAWWMGAHPGTLVSDLGAQSWDEWISAILHPRDWGYPEGLPHPLRKPRT